MSGGPQTVVLAVSATFTAEPVGEILAFWMRELGWESEIRFAPYNQVFQQLLDPESVLAKNRNGVNLVLVRLEDWARAGADGLEANARSFVEALSAAARRHVSPNVVCICPASPQFLADRANAELQDRVEDLIAAGVAPLSSVYLSVPAELNALYPVAEPHDPHGEELGHVPYTPEFFAGLGTLLARKVHALRTAPFKVAVLDCDDTLWQGICGEDGPEGVMLDPPRRELQEFMLRERDAGMLLCLASKNNPEDVEQTFRVHPEMPLQLEHFVARRIGWEPKADGLVALADELNLGLDSFIFIDDNPKELSEVEANCPEVLGLALPADANEIPRFLRHVWAFDRLRVTEEDRQRSAMYAQQFQRDKAEKQAASIEEFLASLQLEVRIGPMAPGDAPRVAQLTQRTNQMNFAPVRRSEAEVRALAEPGGGECLTVHVRDRFGSYGLTGVMIVNHKNNALAVETFLLSCRVLGRGVEHRMLASLGALARTRGIAVVEAQFKRGQRNQPALLFLRSVATPFETEEGVFRIPADAAAAIRYAPGKAPHEAAVRAASKPASSATRTAINYGRIASLWAPAKILDAARRENHHGAMERKTARVEPRTELERRLAAIWAETLGVAGVGVNENFFDLGGHSLLAVELLSRVRRALGADLSLEVVYGGEFTVAELAKAIELREIEQAGAEEYAALLKEVESLSDEEVRAMLEREGEAM